MFLLSVLAVLRGLVHLEVLPQSPRKSEQRSHALPSILQDQEQLTLLRLNCSPETADEPDHTALAASSQLWELHVSGPAGTRQVVFEPGQLLQQPTSVQVDGTCTVQRKSSGKLLADACPALQQLSLHSGELTRARTELTAQRDQWSSMYVGTNNHRSTAVCYVPRNTLCLSIAAQH
jgi:hypothetical protein